MGDRTLYIHIGCHKTGTTSIQQALVHNKQALKSRGMQFFYSNYRTGENRAPELHSWMGYDHEEGLVPCGMRFSDPEKLAEDLSQLVNDVVISSENFSFLFDRGEIERLKKALSRRFSSIKVICYIRRQDQHIVSHHQEGSKLFRQAEYDLFGHSTLAIPDHEPKHDLYLDYHQRLSMWGDAFGDENLIIKVFDRSRLKNGDVVADFFDTMGLVDNFQTIDEKNTSLSFLEAKIGHIVNASDVQHKRWMVGLLTPRMGVSEKLLPSRNEATEFYSHYIESNRRLNQRFGISEEAAVFSNNFDMYPEEQVDAWSEMSANEAIRKIIEAVDDVYGGLTIDEMRDAAIALESVEPMVGLKLMRMAHKLRPEGAFIRRKLNEYQRRMEEGADENTE